MPRLRGGAPATMARVTPNTHTLVDGGLAAHASAAAGIRQASEQAAGEVIPENGGRAGVRCKDRAS